jgi:hypothetical protein
VLLAKYFRTQEAARKAALAHAARHPRWVYAAIPENGHYRVARYAPGDDLALGLAGLTVTPPSNVSPETWAWLIGVIPNPPPCARRELQVFFGKDESRACPCPEGQRE